MWRYTADLLYILENPAVREAFFPTSEHLFFVDPATDADWPAIHEIAVAAEPAEAVVILEDWWRRLPDAFWAARDGAGKVVGFSVMPQIDQVPRSLFDADPLARIFRDHVRRLPVPRGQRVLVLRFQFAHPDDPNQALIIAALILDVKRQYMELRPELRTYLDENGKDVSWEWQAIYSNVPDMEWSAFAAVDPDRFDFAAFGGTDARTCRIYAAAGETQRSLRRHEGRYGCHRNQRCQTRPDTLRRQTRTHQIAATPRCGGYALSRDHSKDCPHTFGLSAQTGHTEPETLGLTGYCRAASFILIWNNHWLSCEVSRRVYPQAFRDERPG
jgi:hypothetical protein